MALRDSKTEALPSALYGVAAAFGAVAAVTIAIYGLRELTPVISTGVLYLLAVLLIAIRWGTALGLGTALAGAVAFNYFHLPPTGRLSVASDGNWVALGVFLVAAVVASRLADDARARAHEAERRTREANALAGLAGALLAAADADQARAVLAARLSEAFGLPSASVELRAAAGDARTLDIALSAQGERMGTLLVPRDTEPETLASLRRVAPSLGAMLAVARRREALESEVVHTRALRQSDTIKTALLRAISHDLRSPLTAIVAAADGLEPGELSDVIGQESHRLSRLVDDLLDLSRLEAGVAQPRIRWCAVDEVIEAAVAALPADALMDLDIEDDLPMVQADPAQLERVFANLLDNARRHGAGRPIALRARRAGHRIRVRVSDSGPGIPQGALERVFQPFHRESEAEGGGAGLGLAIARGFTEANGGRLWAESLPDQGASFVCELPVRVRSGAPA